LPAPYAGGQVATGGQLGLLGNRSVMDTPFNQTSFTAERIADQQSKTIRDVLIDDPSVRSIIRDNGPGEDRIMIRGFPVPVTAMSYGGLFGVLPAWTASAELAERVELLKGPSAMLNGMPPVTAIGGSINIVPKHATDTPIANLTTDYSSKSNFGSHIDVGRRYGENNEFGIRFNGVFRDGNTAVNNSSERRDLAVVGLDYRGENVRLSADFGHQHQRVDGVVPYIGVFDGVPIPKPPRASANLGQPWTYRNVEDTFGVIRGEVDLADNVTAYAAIGGRDNKFGGLLASTTLVSNAAGDALLPVGALNQYDRDVSGEAGLRATFETGELKHKLAFSVSALGDETGIGRSSSTILNTNIYAPTTFPRPNLVAARATKTSSLDLASAALGDTISAFNDRVQLTVGGRLQRVRSSSFDPTGAKTNSYDESALTPMVGLVLKPWDRVSIYGNIIQGLQQGTIVDDPAFSNFGQVFAPYKSTQYETGVKIDWGRFTTTLSAFQISQPSTRVDVASNTLNVDGEQRNRGIEFNVFGKVSESTRLLGGVMFIDPVLAKTQDGLADGWIAPFSPRVQVNLAGEWDTPFIDRLTLTSRVVYTGRQYIDTTTPRRELPDWTRVDMGARYVFDGTKTPTGKPITVRFDVENIFDNTYIASGFASTAMSVGAPRTYRLSTTFRF